MLLDFEEGLTVFKTNMNNDRTFAMLRKTFYDPGLLERMECVTIVAAASPEGSFEAMTRRWGSHIFHAAHHSSDIFIGRTE